MLGNRLGHQARGKEKKVVAGWLAAWLVSRMGIIDLNERSYEFLCE